MDKKTKSEPSRNILRLPKNRPVASVATDKKAGNSNDSTVQASLTSSAPTESNHDITAPPKPARSFSSIYKELHSKFPAIINMDKPVLLAVGIRKEMSNATGVSSVVLKKWIAWYCSKSHYYDIHAQGAIRFNLDGSEAGTVTEKHQEKMDKKLEKTKARKSSLESTEKNIKEDIDKDSNNDIDKVVTDK